MWDTDTPQIQPVQQFGLSGDQLRPEAIVASITEQIHSTGWGKKLEKLRGPFSNFFQKRALILLQVSHIHHW
jgi:hypothetical protein